jgi:hypothetical protein
MFKRLALVCVLLCLSARLASAQILYGTTGVNSAVSSLYTVNTSTGATTLVGATGFSGIGSLSFSPGGVLFGVANGSSRSLVTINLSTGVATLKGPTGATANITDIAFRSDGVLFAADGGARLYTLNTTTGVATLIGTVSPSNNFGNGLAFNASNTLYYADGSQLHTLNQATAAATLAGTLDFSAFPVGSNNNRFVGMKFNPTSGVLFGSVFSDFEPASASRLASISTFSGTITVTNIGVTGVILEAVAIAPAGVPVLPQWGTGVLAVLVTAVALWALRRRASLVVR